MDPTQMKFILHIQVWFNIEISVNAIHYTNRLSKKSYNMILSTNSEIIFDNIQHSFARKTAN